MGKEIIYGFHTIESTLLHDSKNLSGVEIDKNRKDKRVQKIVKLLESKKVAFNFVDRKQIDKKVPNNKHQGIIAFYEGSQNLSKIKIDTLLNKKDLFILILDEIQDPHNLGAILRSANAAGVDAVIIPKNKSVGITPTVRKIASGGAENTPVIQVSNINQLINKLKESDILCIGTSGEATLNYYEQDFKGKIAIVVGSEGSGMRKLVKENCEVLIKIPMLGVVESLNVSVATGIILFEALKQRVNY